MAGKVKTWVWVVVGLVVCGILCLVAMAAAGLWFAKTHIDIRTASRVTVSEDFSRVRRQFTNQKPLIELDDRGHLARTNTDRPAGAHAARQRRRTEIGCSNGTAIARSDR